MVKNVFKKFQLFIHLFHFRKIVENFWSWEEKVKINWISRQKKMNLNNHYNMIIFKINILHKDAVNWLLYGKNS